MTVLSLSSVTLMCSFAPACRAVVVCSGSSGGCGYFSSVSRGWCLWVVLVFWVFFFVFCLSLLVLVDTLCPWKDAPIPIHCLFSRGCLILLRGDFYFPSLICCSGAMIGSPNVWLASVVQNVSFLHYYIWFANIYFRIFSFKSCISKLWLTGEIQLTANFLYNLWAKNSFYILK